MADDPGLSDLGDLGDFAGFGDFEAWAAEARAKEAAESRVRERWLRAQAEEGTHWLGVLTGLVEHEADVTITTAAGRQVTGRLAAVGADFVTLIAPGGRTTLVAVAAVAWLRPGADRSRLRADDRPPVDELDNDAAPLAAALIDVLAQAVANRPRVSIVAHTGGVTGELRAVGVDVVALELAGSPPGLAYVPLASIYEISFLDSG